MPTAFNIHSVSDSSPVSIQTQSLALRALRALCKRKPQETQEFALASSQSWLPLLRPSIPIGWRLRLLRENFTQLKKSTRGDNFTHTPCHAPFRAATNFGMWGRVRDVINADKF